MPEITIKLYFGKDIRRFRLDVDQLPDPFVEICSVAQTKYLLFAEPSLCWQELDGDRDCINVTCNAELAAAIFEARRRAGPGGDSVVRLHVKSVGQIARQLQAAKDGANTRLFNFDGSKTHVNPTRFIVGECLTHGRFLHVTVTVQATMGTSTFYCGVICYDKDGRPISSHRVNHTGTATIKSISKDRMRVETTAPMENSQRAGGAMIRKNGGQDPDKEPDYTIIGPGGRCAFQAPAGCDKPSASEFYEDYNGETTVRLLNPLPADVVAQIKPGVSTFMVCNASSTYHYFVAAGAKLEVEDGPKTFEGTIDLQKFGPNGTDGLWWGTHSFQLMMLPNYRSPGSALLLHDFKAELSEQSALVHDLNFEPL